MPIEIANLYLQLGVAGAALFIVLFFGWLYFKSINKQSSKFHKLCDKIDKLFDSFNENTKVMIQALTSNDKGQKETIKYLENINNLVIENHRRISRIDDRTYKCLGNTNENERG